MIKITSELSTTSGFTSNESVLQIISYTITDTVQLVNQPISPLPAIAGKNISISYQIFKSIDDKIANASPYQPKGIPYNFSFTVQPEDEIDESFIYNKVRTKLNDLGYNTQWL